MRAFWCHPAMVALMLATLVTFALDALLWVQGP